MNLSVTQSNQSTEQGVPSEAVNKQYNLAVSSTPPTELEGNISLDGPTYEEYVSTLKEKYPKLYITAPAFYVKFQDPVTESKLANAIGDGTGVTSNNIQSVTDNKVIGNIDFTDCTYFHEFGKFTGLTTIGEMTYAPNDVALRTVSEVTLPYIEMYRAHSVSFFGSVYICPRLSKFAPYLSNDGYDNGDRIQHILYIGGTNLESYYLADMPMFDNVNNNPYSDSKMLYLSNATSITQANTCESTFGNRQGKKACPYQIVYLRGINGIKTTIGDRVFANCSITNLIINNTVLPDIKNSLLTATYVYLPSSILTATESAGTTTYSLNLEAVGLESNPWNGYTPTFLPIDEFPTAETLDSWRDEGKPIKLIESLM